MQSNDTFTLCGGWLSAIGVRGPAFVKSWALAIALFAGSALSGCGGLYLHDPALEADTTATIKSVNEADVSPQVTATLDATTLLASKEEVAVVRFWTSQRNLELSNLLQPDPLERQYFKTKYTPSGASYVRDAASLAKDIQHVVDCRLKELLGADIDLGGCRSTDANANGTEPQYEALRDQASAFLQSTDDQVNNARESLSTFRTNLAQQYALHPGSTWEKDFGLSCEKAAKAPPKDPAATLDDVALAFDSFAQGCADLAAEIANTESALEAKPGSLIDGNRQVIKSLLEEQKKREQAIAELKQQLADLEAASSGAAPDQSKLEAAVAEIQKLLKSADGAAKLTGLQGLQALLDQLTQIELDNVNKEAAGAPAEASDSLAARGAALLKLADATENAIKAYQGADPADKAQSLIIAAIAVQQKISIALIEDDLDESKLRLRKGLDQLYSGEVHTLAEAGLAIMQSDLKTTSSHDAVVSVAGSWDSYRIPGSVIQFREMQAERQAAIRISAVNAADTQKVVAAAMAAVDAYAKGGITEAQILDIISKFFIGGAILK